jgi:hypothetical protein
MANVGDILDEEKYTVVKIQFLYSQKGIAQPQSNSYIYVFVAIYIFPGSGHFLAAEKICDPILEIYNSLTKI